MRSASSKGRLPDAAGLTVLRRLMDNRGMKTLFRPAPLLPAFIGLALLTCVGLASAQDSRGAGVPSVVRNAPVALDVLRGRWVRPDGGYGVVIGGVTWLTFMASGRIAKMMGRTGINVMTRLMGLILAAMAVELLADGLVKLFPGLAR